jgi:hypothetical protein
MGFDQAGVCSGENFNDSVAQAENAVGVSVGEFLILSPRPLKAL